MVVKWSACSPSPPTIRVRILLTSTVFSVKFVLEKNKIKKMLGVAHLKKAYLEHYQTSLEVIMHRLYKMYLYY